VKCDPASHVIFEGFRVGENFYTDFCVQLLRNLMLQVPSLHEFRFDGYSSVSRTSPLLNGLVGEVKAYQKRVIWGPDLAWGNMDIEQMLGDMSLGA
jgi:hypothetical protein